MKNSGIEDKPNVSIILAENSVGIGTVRLSPKVLAVTDNNEEESVGVNTADIEANGGRGNGEGFVRKSLKNMYLRQESELAEMLFSIDMMALSPIMQGDKATDGATGAASIQWVGIST